MLYSYHQTKQKQMEVKQMKFFVDTANVADIKKANDLGVICGVTKPFFKL